MKKAIAIFAVIAVASFVLAAVAPDIYNEIVNWIAAFFNRIGQDAGE